MDRTHLIDQLARHGDVFRAHFTGLVPAEVLWKPAPEKWCTLEIVCHLYDEERDDFHARLQHVLSTPDAPLPPTDPPGWMIERRYLEQDFNSMLGQFLEERQRTVQWLRTLDNAPWSNAHPLIRGLGCAAKANFGGFGHAFDGVVGIDEENAVVGQRLGIGLSGL